MKLLTALIINNINFVIFNENKINNAFKDADAIIFVKVGNKAPTESLNPMKIITGCPKNG